MCVKRKKIRGLLCFGEKICKFLSPQFLENFRYTYGTAPTVHGGKQLLSTFQISGSMCEGKKFKTASGPMKSTNLIAQTLKYNPKNLLRLSL
jgi:hypothetical protein